MPNFARPDFNRIAALFGEVPAPRTYADAVNASALLLRFLERAAMEIHARVHGGAIPVSCRFDVSPYLGMGTIEQTHPESWNAAVSFARWSAAFDGGLAAHHRDTVADRTIQLLRARIGGTVKASELAREVGCSVPMLNRVFRRATGRSVHEYAAEMRVDRVIDLLHRTNWKVEAIAREVGWKSKKDLYLSVRRAVKMTPGQIRRLGVGSGVDNRGTRLCQPAAVSRVRGAGSD